MLATFVKIVNIIGSYWPIFLMLRYIWSSIRNSQYYGAGREGGILTIFSMGASSISRIGCSFWKIVQCALILHLFGKMRAEEFCWYAKARKLWTPFILHFLKWVKLPKLNKIMSIFVMFLSLIRNLFRISKTLWFF